MYVKVVNGRLNGKPVGQMLADSGEEVDDELTYNVIEQQEPLLGLNADDFQTLQKGEIHIFLLFALEQIHQRVRHKATMSGTAHRHDARQITGLRC